MAAIAVVVHHQAVIDFVRGRLYAPTTAVAEIRENLALTAYGEFIFDASRPELNSEKDFNANCVSDSEDEAALGCYRGQKIYVYEVQSEELAGILELTAAHELLHAVYERRSDGEKEIVGGLLKEVYRQYHEVLAAEIEAYDVEEQAEELYVRAGTEIKELPEELEKHYAKIFADQDKVVGFYESYIGVFRGLEAELKSLEAEMTELKEQIDAKSLEYQNGAKDLGAQIEVFNNCASQVGCFQRSEDFNARRNELLARQAEMRGLYDEIDGLINQYNMVVEKYNQNVVRSQNLQDLINSHVVVEGL